MALLLRYDEKEDTNTSPTLDRPGRSTNRACSAGHSRAGRSETLIAYRSRVFRNGTLCGERGRRGTGRKNVRRKSYRTADGGREGRATVPDTVCEITH